MTAETEVRKEVYEVLKVEIEDQCGSDMGSHQDLPKVGADCNGIKHDVNGNGEDDPNHSCVFVGPDLNGDCADKSGSNSGSESKENKDIVGELNFRDGEKVDNCFVQGKDVTPPDSDVAPDTLPFKPEGQGANVVAKTVTEEEQNGTAAVDFEPNPLDGEVKIEEEAQTGTAAVDIEPRPLGGVVKVEEEAQNGAVAVDFEPCLLDGEVKVEEEAQNATAGLDFEPHPLDGEVKVEGEAKNGTLAMDFEPRPLDGGVKVGEEMQNGEVKVEKKRQNGTATVDFEPHPLEGEVKVEEEERNGAAAVDVEPSPLDGAVRVEEEEQNGPAAIDFEPHQMKSEVNVEEEEQNGTAAIDFEPHQQDGEVKVEKEEHIGTAAVDFESHPLDGAVKVGDEEQNGAVAVDSDQLDGEVKVEEKVQPEVVSDGEKGEGVLEAHQDDVDRVKLDKLDNLESTPELDVVLKFGYSSDLRLNTEDNKPTTELEGIEESQTVVSETAGCKCTPTSIGNNLESTTYHSRNAEEIACQVTELGVGKVMLEEQTQFESVRQVQESLKSQITSTKAEPNTYQLASTSTETAPSTSTELAPDAIQLETEVAPNAYQLETEEKKCEEKIRTEEAECRVTELGVGKVMLEEQTQFESVREVQESLKSQISSTKAEPNAYQLATTSAETAPSTSTELAPDAIQLETEVAPNAYQLETGGKKCEEKIRAEEAECQVTELGVGKVMLEEQTQFESVREVQEILKSQITSTKAEPNAYQLATTSAETAPSTSTELTPDAIQLETEVAPNAYQLETGGKKCEEKIRAEEAECQVTELGVGKVMLEEQTQFESVREVQESLKSQVTSTKAEPNANQLATTSMETAPSTSTELAPDAIRLETDVATNAYQLETEEKKCEEKIKAEEAECQVTELGVGKVMLEEQTQFESVREVQESLKSQITSTKAEPNAYRLATTSTETAPSTSTELVPDAIQLETEVAPNAYQLETEEKKCEEKIRTEEAECQVTELGVGKVMLEEQTQFDSVREVQESWKSQITSTKAEPNAYQLATTSVETAPSTSTELAPDAIQLEMEVAPNAYQLETEEKKCEEKIRADSDLPTNIANVENDVGISQTEVLSDDNRQTGVTSNKIDVNQQTSIDGNEQNEVSEQLSESVDGNEQTEVSELLSESIDGSQQTEVLIKSIDGHQRTFSSGNAEGSPIGCDNQTSVDQDGASTCVADDMKSETEVENLSIKSGENVIFVDDAKSEIFEKGLNGANDVNTEIDVDLGSIKPVDKVPAIPRNKVDTENVIELDTSSRAMVGADATEVINVEDTDTQLRGESGKKENCEEIRDSRDGISASVPGSYSADDGRSTVLDYRKRPFHFLIRIPRYDDENLREQIRLAQLQLDEKTKIRDAIRSEIQMKKDYYIDYEEAKSKERAARELVKSKRQEIDSVQYVINKVKNAISVEDIDSRIHNMEHMIQHETLPLKEEKQFIREIKQLKHLREQLSSNMGSQEELQQAIEQREEIEKRLRVLKKELDSLREKVSKAEVTSGAAEKKFKDENKRLKELKAQFRVADGIRQEAYAHLQSLKKQLYEKNHHFRMYRDNVMSACDYASTGNREALHHLCVDQVERFMELWNEDDVFRKEYIRCNTRSTLRRLNTLDGRALGPDEEPPVLPNLVDERADRPHFYPVKDNSMSLISTSEQAKLGSVMEGEDVDNKAMMKMAEQKKQTTKPKKPAKSNLGSGPVTAAGQERKVNEREQTKEEQELARKAEELKKQEAASKLREQHRLEEEAAVKLKEQRRLEEKAKAKEALERKKRNAEKAQLRAELRAQREAEQKEKEKEKRARKKDRKKVVATEAADCNNEGESAPTSDSQSENNRSPEIKETQISVAKKSQKPSQFSKQIKAKSIPPPLRKKGKRWMQQWMWVILAALFVLALFLLGNSGFSFNLGLQSMRF